MLRPCVGFKCNTGLANISVVLRGEGVDQDDNALYAKVIQKTNKGARITFTYQAPEVKAFLDAARNQANAVAAASAARRDVATTAPICCPS